jgi:hypothetical protein
MWKKKNATQTRSVSTQWWPCHLFTLKRYLKGKRRIMEKTLKYFTMQKKKKSSKKPLKESKNPSRYYYYNSIITNLKFQHNPKRSCFKNPHIKINLLLLLLLRGPIKSLKLLLYSIMNLNTISLPW